VIKEFAIATPNKPVNSAIFRQETNCNLYVRDDVFYISGCDSQDEANALIAAHNPPALTEPTIAEKLASVGLSLDELKAAILGGN
jgi:hypothetical protein